MRHPAVTPPFVFVGLLCVLAARGNECVPHVPDEELLPQADLIVEAQLLLSPPPAVDKAKPKPAPGTDSATSDIEIPEEVQDTIGVDLIRGLRDEGPADDLPPAVQFVVEKTLKGRTTEKTIWVRPAVRYSHDMLFTWEVWRPGRSYVLMLRAPPAGEKAWQSFMPPFGSQIELPQLARVSQAALVEMEAFDPEAVRQARALWPRVAAAARPIPYRPLLKVGRITPTPFAAKPGDLAKLLEPEPWPELRKAPLAVLRALGILAYPQTYLPALDAAVGERLGKPQPDDVAAAKAFMKFHFRRLKADAMLDAFVDSSPKTALGFFGYFPPASDYFGICRNGACEWRIVRDYGTPLPQAIDAEAARTIEFLIRCEQPGLPEFRQPLFWLEKLRRYGVRPGQLPNPIYGKMRAEWIQELLVGWARSDEPPRREVALWAMNENPGPWVREFVEAERKAGRLRPSDLILPAAGLGDATLLIELWKEAQKDAGREELQVVLNLMLAHAFHAEVAAFAVERWQADLAGAPETKGLHCDEYLSLYRWKLGRDKAEKFSSPEEARVWIAGLLRPKE